MKVCFRDGEAGKAAGVKEVVQEVRGRGGGKRTWRWEEEVVREVSSSKAPCSSPPKLGTPRPLRCMVAACFGCSSPSPFASSPPDIFCHGKPAPTKKEVLVAQKELDNEVESLASTSTVPRSYQELACSSPLPQARGARIQAQEGSTRSKTTRGTAKCRKRNGTRATPQPHKHAEQPHKHVLELLPCALHCAKRAWPSPRHMLARRRGIERQVAPAQGAWAHLPHSLYWGHLPHSLCWGHLQERLYGTLLPESSMA